MVVATDGSSQLIAALRDPARHVHPVTRVDVLETHASWVILTGRHAYKIKKPLDLGFLDFSTLDARHRYCEAELRLNRRFAPALYEEVVRITGTAACPVLGGDGPAIEYAVRMREFPQQALASRLLVDGTLTVSHIEALAARIAAFHACAPIAAFGSPYGTAESVITPVRDNFVQLARLLPDDADQARIAAVRGWSEQEFHEHHAVFDARPAGGSVRECHGDLHLGNIVMLDGQLTPFDCIEFDPALRWIDVMSEIAFLIMDLMDRGRADFGACFLNAYLEARATPCGYSGLAVLRFYRVYRALVRAKVQALRAAQSGIADAEHTRLVAASRGYIDLALRCTQDARPALVVMHGLSGSGKSTIAQSLTQSVPAICVRSDVERKRLVGLPMLARSHSAVASGIYTADLTARTYHRLLDLARLCLNAGHTVIVDATFLKRWQRDLFRREARARGVPFVIIDVTAPQHVLRTRVAARLAADAGASEADLAVLAQQSAQHEVLTPEESAAVLSVDSARADLQTIQQNASLALRRLLATDATAPAETDAQKTI